MNVNRRITLTICAACLASIAGESHAQCPVTQFADAPPSYTSPTLYRVAIDVDGHIAIMGGQRAFPAGAAFIYERQAGHWSRTATLTPPAGTSNDQFGVAVSISGDTAVVGAWNHPNQTATGAAYFFVRNAAGVWTFQDKVQAADAAPGDRFGWSVAIDGDVAMIAAINDDDEGVDSGAVYAFARNGTDWTQQAKITMPDIVSSPFSPTGFGCSIAIDGGLAVIGARRYNARKGAALVFSRTGDTWLHSASLVAADAEEFAEFGTSVDLDAGRAAIGSPDRNVFYTNSGAAYVFRSEANNVWTQEARLTQTVEDARWDDDFGEAVSISGDLIAVGYPFDDEVCPTNPLCESGSVHVFRRNGTTWNRIGEITDPGAFQGQQFGLAVDVSGDDLLIGMPPTSAVAGVFGRVFMYAGLLEVDCNRNDVPDGCDIGTGFSNDSNNNGVPDECEPDVPGDVNGDGVVNVNDLLAVTSAWGPCAAPPTPCPADIAPEGGDGHVNVNDLLLVVTNWS